MTIPVIITYIFEGHGTNVLIFFLIIYYILKEQNLKQFICN